MQRKAKECANVDKL
jgi:RNA-dependent RNA polymerase